MLCLVRSIHRMEETPDQGTSCQDSAQVSVLTRSQRLNIARAFPYKTEGVTEVCMQEVHFPPTQFHIKGCRATKGWSCKW